MVDYKSYNKAFDLVDAYAGQALQMLAYLNALQAANPGEQLLGSLYLRLYVPTVDAGKEGTAEELKELGLIDDVIKEPKTGAHRDKDGAIKALGNYVLTELHKLDDLSIDELISRRQQKILRFGAYKEN